MASVPDFDPGENSPRSRVVMALVVVVVLALLYVAYRELTAPVTRKVKNDQSVLAIQPDLPPPPPPPPPPPQPQQKPPEPADQSKAVAEPKAAPNAPPAQTQMDAAPSAGAGGIAAGGGSGMGAPGSCLVGPCGTGGGGGGVAAPINEGFYLRTLSGELQTYIDRDRKLSRMVFDARLHITVSASGAVTAVEMVSPSGKAEVDSQLTVLLRGLHNLSTPPAGIHFPLNVKVRGRRAFSMRLAPNHVTKDS